MKILLLYKGYPRVSHSYQYDEAIEISKYHDVKIISYEWKLYVTEKNAPPYDLLTHSEEEVIKYTQKYSPDIIHSVYFNNLQLLEKITTNTNIFFTVSGHSFDILTVKNWNTYVKIINGNKCKGVIVFPSFKKILTDAGVNENKIKISYPSINIKNFINSETNGNDVMGGGAMLPKKNIPGFIMLAKKIKNYFPSININYYGVVENQEYFNEIIKINNENKNPVNFICVQHCDMPFEYKKHKWLIYTCCTTLKTVGNPIMVAEAQASGVGVIMYKLRDNLNNYVTENGFLYEKDEDVIDIMKNGFDNNKRQNAINLSSRYQIDINLLNNMWSS